MNKTFRRLLDWTRAGLFTLLVHGAIVFLLIFGLFKEPEKMVAAGKPIQAVTVSQADLDRKKQDQVQKLEELEQQRKAEQAEELKRVEEALEKKKQEKKEREELERKQLAEQKKQEEAEKQKQIEAEQKQQELARKSKIKENCVQLVEEEDASGKINSELDNICEDEREKLRERKVEQEKIEQEKKAEKQRKQEEAEQREREEAKKQAEAEKQRKLEEEKRRKEEAERQRKEQEAKKKAEEEKRRKAEEARKAEQQRQAELEMQRQLQQEQQAALAAQTEREAVDAFQAIAGRLKAAIENNWRRPAGARSGLTATFEIDVAPNGQVNRVTLVRSSGDQQFDRSGELAIQKASPLPIPTNPKYYDYIKTFQTRFSPDE